MADGSFHDIVGAGVLVHVKKVGARERMPDETPPTMKYPLTKRCSPSRGSGSVTNHAAVV